MSPTLATPASAWPPPQTYGKSCAVTAVAACVSALIRPVGRPLVWIVKLSASIIISDPVRGPGGAFANAAAVGRPHASTVAAAHTATNRRWNVL